MLKCKLGLPYLSRCFFPAKLEIKDLLKRWTSLPFSFYQRVRQFNRILGRGKELDAEDGASLDFSGELHWY